MKDSGTQRIYKAIQDPKRAAEALKRRVLGIFKHKAYARFIVLTRSRTGSNMLISFLNSHPDIYTLGEIFPKLNGEHYQSILDKAFSKHPLYIKAVGFKIFYYHPLDDKDSALWHELILMRNLCVIHLKRKNLLRTLVSRKIAGKQDIWEANSAVELADVNEKKVEFSAEELQSGFEQTRGWESEYAKMFAAHPMVTVYYEDLVRDPGGEFNRIADMLHLRHHIPETNLLKQNPEKLSQLIINYAQLKQSFCGTQWAPFFED
jgi:LPS sulfotransferase NodH